MINLTLLDMAFGILCIGVLLFSLVKGLLGDDGGYADHEPGEWL